MPRRQAAIPQVQMRIVSGEQQLGIAHTETTPLPPLKEILRQALTEAIQNPQRQWGSTIEVSFFPEGNTVVLPTMQCAHELGLPVARLTLASVDWENGIAPR